jgi:hypothetical protein
MSNLQTGNVVIDPSSYKGQFTSPLPGYEFYKVHAYVALGAQANNRFPLWVPSQEKMQPRKQLALPYGSQVYHVGYRLGDGVYSEALQDLTLTPVINGTPTTAAGLVLDGIQANTSAIDGVARLAEQPQQRQNTRTTLLRIARAPAFDPARMDAFNLAFANNLLDYPALTTIPQFAQIELQLRDRSVPNVPASPLSALGAGIGGLRQRPEPEFKDQGYILFQIGYFAPTDRVVSEEDFSGVIWDEVFANV